MEDGACNGNTRVGDTGAFVDLSTLMLGLAASERTRDLINVVYRKFHVAKRSQGMIPNPDGFYTCDLVLDVRQDVRRSTKTEGHLRSMCSGSVYYSFCLDRAIQAIEHLALLGWSQASLSSIAQEFSPSMIRDLAGESMACPCVGLAASALALCVGGVWSDR